MKEFLNKKGLIIVLSTLLLIVFVFGGMYSRYMTNQIDVNEQNRYETSLLELVNDGVTLEYFDAEGVDKSYHTPGSEDEYSPSLLDSYKVMDDSNVETAVIYVIETIGISAGFVAAYAISVDDDQLLAVKVISHNETDNQDNRYFNRLNDAFFNQFTNKDLDVIDFSVDTIAGATLSSLALDIGMKYARELYAADYAFEIINVILEINSLNYNYDLDTINEFSFIAEITFDEDDKTAIVHLDTDFNYIDTSSGDEVTQGVIDALPVFVSKTHILCLDVTIEGYDETTRELSISVNGYSLASVKMIILINSALDAVENVTFISSDESYDYSHGYSGSGVPEVEQGYIDGFNSQGVILDETAGATVTSHAMGRAIEWIKSLEIALNGGN
ncbi:MAG: FMN-binding protein [Tenericutes bacterium]|jgi:Na+-translocating ferredoxin:NAD+ oxidoreductase RnfG subunit|nr:FMN-binding protein [Mycoplasmatota bacterium]